MIRTLHSVPHDMARSCSKTFDPKLLNQLLGLKMSDLDALWMCDLKHCEE